MVPRLRFGATNAATGLFSENMGIFIQMEVIFISFWLALLRECGKTENENSVSWLSKMGTMKVFFYCRIFRPRNWLPRSGALSASDRPDLPRRMRLGRAKTGFKRTSIRFP